MAYVPNNDEIFTAAFSGAMAGMAASNRVPFSALAATYTGVAQVAGAFAQCFDTLWGPGPLTNSLDIELTRQLTEVMWQNRAPNAQSPLLSPATFEVECEALIAMITASAAYYAGQGIVPPPIGPTPGGSANEVQVNDGSGGFAGAAGVKGGTAFISVQVNGIANLPTTGFLRFESAAANMCTMRSADNLRDMPVFSSDGSDALYIGSNVAVNSAWSGIRMYGTSYVYLGTTSATYVALESSAVSFRYPLKGSAAPYQLKSGSVATDAIPVSLSPTQIEFPTLVMTGAGGTVEAPNTVDATYTIVNDAASAVTFKTPLGTGVSVDAGDTAIVRCDGTNYNLVANASASSAPDTALFSPVTLTKQVGVATEAPANNTFGWRFRVQREGMQCTGLRFITPAAGPTQTVRAKLWNLSGIAVATRDQSIIYAGSGTNGVIQEILFTTPIALTWGDLYTASLFVTTVAAQWSPNPTMYGVRCPPSAAFPLYGSPENLYVGAFIVAGDNYPVTNAGGFYSCEPIIEYI